MEILDYKSLLMSIYSGFLSLLGFGLMNYVTQVS